jgi:cytosine/adenosine deaminase-related metal-dependent hydrolase
MRPPVPPEPDHLLVAARRKSGDAIARARAAIRAMHSSGVEVTFAGVAHHAGVSRQWLYKNTALRAEIEKLRASQPSSGRVPAAQRASDASLRQRNALLTEENKRLRTHVAELKEELAVLYGDRRRST